MNNITEGSKPIDSTPSGEVKDGAAEASSHRCPGQSQSWHWWSLTASRQCYSSMLTGSASSGAPAGHVVPTSIHCNSHATASKITFVKAEILHKCPKSTESIKLLQNELAWVLFSVTGTILWVIYSTLNQNLEHSFPVSLLELYSESQLCCRLSFAHML